MKSMTGYGRADRQDNASSIDVEVRSINSRYFKLSWKLPQEMGPYENEVKKIISEHISRGAVTVNIYYTNDNTEAQGRVNRPLLRSYYRELTTLAQQLGCQTPGLEALLLLPETVAESAPQPLSSGKWLEIRQVLLQALAAFEEMRNQEGQNLAEEIVGYCQLIQENIDKIEDLVPTIQQNYYERLKKKMLEFAALENFKFTQEDILKEVALFAEKADVCEELARLKSHLSQFRSKLSATQPVGKTLDFILQEMVREVNTISAKVNNAHCSNMVVELKSCIEKIKEQVQNIE